MKSLLLFIGWILLIPISLMWHGYVFATIWDWFLVPHFGVGLMSIPVAIGIMALTRLGTYQIPKLHDVKVATEDKEEGDDILDFVVHALSAILIPASVLLTSWIVSHYV